MKKGNTALYIIIGVIALAVIAFLVMRNKDQTMKPADDAITNETPSDMDNSATDDSMMDDTAMDSGDASTNGGVMVGGAMMTPDKDIVDNAMNSSDHTTLVAAVKAAGLVETLKGDGPFTVFAPTNDAFDKLPAGTVDEILKPENKAQLTKILTYHVVPGKYTSDMITEGLKLKTVNGDMLTFTKKDGQWWINDVGMITIADAVSSNGVTHVIDTVLLPQN